MFTVIERIAGKYLESNPELKFVADINDNEIPRNGETVVISGNEFQVTEVERNYDTRNVIVYVNRKVTYNDVFEM